MASESVPQADQRSALHPLKFFQGQLNVLASIRLVPLQHEIDDAHHLVGDGHHRLPFAPPPGVSLVELMESGVEATGSMSALDHHGGYALVPWA